jgi:hypothetical protein
MREVERSPLVSVPGSVNLTCEGGVPMKKGVARSKLSTEEGPGEAGTRCSGPSAEYGAGRILEAAVRTQGLTTSPVLMIAQRERTTRDPSSKSRNRSSK